MKKTILMLILIMLVNIANSQKFTKINLDLSQSNFGIDSAEVTILYYIEEDLKSYEASIRNNNIINGGENQSLNELIVFDGESKISEIEIYIIFYSGRKYYYKGQTRKIIPGYEYLIKPKIEKKKVFLGIKKKFLNVHYYYLEIE